MNKILCIIILTLLLNVGLAQSRILVADDIPALNRIIKSLEVEYKENEKLIFRAIPQTTASYFRIRAGSPEMFLNALNNSENIEQLKIEFPNLQVDENLLIIKSLNNSNEILEIESFEIMNSGSHRVKIPLRDSVDFQGGGRSRASNSASEF